jgi:HAD superfamily hydrolase (TIGR01509 family)
VLIIFDCDGVLIDSELIALDVLSVMMGRFGHPMSVSACQDAFMGMHNADIIRAIEARIGRSLPADEGSRMRAGMIERMRRELKPVTGVADALERLHGPRCVASSSDRDRIALTLDLTGLSRFFGDHIFSGTEVAHGKPAPDLFLHAAATMGVAPRDCIVIEDAVAGVRAGIAAGMRVIGFTGGSHTNASHASRLRESGAGPIIAAMTDLPDAIAGAFA